MSTQQQEPVPGKETCDAGWETWNQVIGVCAYGTFRKALLPLLTSKHCPTPEDLSEAIRCFHAEKNTQKVERRAFYTIHQFAGRIQEFLRIARLPLMVEGEFTEKGELLSRP